MIKRALLLEQLADLVVMIERSHPVRVAIDGMPGAGKSVLADEMVSPIETRGRPTIRASVDGFHRPKAERYRRGAESPEGYYYDAFDYQAVRNALLVPLGPHGDRRYRSASFNLRGDRRLAAPAREALSEAVLLCDGVFLQRPELNDCWDFRIFVQVDERVAVKRAQERDRLLLGSRDAAAGRYWKRYVPAHRIYEEAVHPRDWADVVVDNTNPEDPRWFRKPLSD